MKMTTTKSTQSNPPMGYEDMCIVAHLNKEFNRELPDGNFNAFEIGTKLSSDELQRQTRMSDKVLFNLVVDASTPTTTTSSTVNTSTTMMTTTTSSPMTTMTMTSTMTTTTTDEALGMALAEFESKSAADRRKVVVLLTDGDGFCAVSDSTAWSRSLQTRAFGASTRARRDESAVDCASSALRNREPTMYRGLPGHFAAPNEQGTPGYDAVHDGQVSDKSSTRTSTSRSTRRRAKRITMRRRGVDTVGDIINELPRIDVDSVDQLQHSVLVPF